MPKFIEIRRHSLRRPPAPHLIQEGVTLARQVGEIIGPFELVVTSTAARAFETAIAMGFAVDREQDFLSRLPDDVDAVLPWPQPFEAYHLAQDHPVVAKHLSKLQRFYAKIALELREGGSALVVCHGGIVEMSAVACVPDAGQTAFGPQIEYCEGVRLTWDKGSFQRAELLRL
jgi:phosphohistidine phosphatase SixA